VTTYRADVDDSDDRSGRLNPVNGSPRDREAFLAYIRLLTASLEAALLLPEPQWFGSYRGGFANWELDDFLDRARGWLEDTDQWPPPFTGEPIEQILFPVDDPTDLTSYLRSIEDWASRTTWSGSPRTWSVAAETLRAGALYE
jgi:hypothetical protein